MSKLHTDQELRSIFGEVEHVIADSLRFKRKLSIGGDAYKSIRLGKSLQQLWDVGGVAATGGTFAASSTVASTFFTTTGFLGWGATAITPIGWVIAAAVGSGSAYYGVTRLFRKFGQDRVEAIPKFINTPIDLLGASLMDLLGTLAFKVAAIDGNVDQSEIQVIQEYFVAEWGYDPLYTEKALTVLLENSEQGRIAEMIETFASFIHSNPDCNSDAIHKELLSLVAQVAGADGKLDEREQLAIDKMEQLLNEHGSALSPVGQVASAPTKTLRWVSQKLFRRNSS